MPNNKTSSTNKGKPTTKRPKKPAVAAPRQGSRSDSKASGVEWVHTKELAPDCLEFPIRDAKAVLRRGSTGSFLSTIRLGLDQALTSDGSGLITSVFSNSPTSAQNWSSYAGTFDEYRVLAYNVTFKPLWPCGGSTQTFWAPIARVVDRSDATALTSYALASRYDSFKESAGQRKFSQWWNMTSVEEAAFISTSSSTPNSWIKLYSSGNSASLTVGRVEITYLVQFRGLGIN